MQRTRSLRMGIAATVVAGLAVLAWVLWPAADPGGYRSARATVLAPATCGSGTGGEVVRVGPQRFGARRAVLNSCGHRRDETLRVEVREADSGGRLAARLPGTGVPDAAVTERKIAAVLLVAAAGGSAVLAWRLEAAPRPGRLPRAGRGRHRAGRR